MLNMNIISMISTVISDIDWLAKYNFAGITIMSNSAWVHSPVFGDVELRLYYGTKVGPEMVGKHAYYEEVINLPESVYKRLMALCKDLAGEARPYISGSPVGGITSADEPSSVGVVSGITEDEEEDTGEEEEVGLDIENVKEPYEVVGINPKYVNPCFSPLPWGQAKEVAYLLRRFRREVINEVLPVVKTEEEYEEVTRGIWLNYSCEYYRFVR